MIFFGIIELNDIECINWVFKFSLLSSTPDNGSLFSLSRVLIGFYQYHNYLNIYRKKLTYCLYPKNTVILSIDAHMFILGDPDCLSTVFILSISCVFSVIHRSQH